MADETLRRYLFVAIDPLPGNRLLANDERGATRWVFVRIYNSKTTADARRFLRDLERACPLRIRTILTDNGKEFTDRLFGLRKRAQSGKHEFDTLCAALDIEHRLTPAGWPPLGMAIIDLSGLAVLWGYLAREIVLGCNWKNLVVLAILPVLILGNRIFHWEAAHGIYPASGVGLRTGLAVGIMLTALIGGRVVQDATGPKLPFAPCAANGSKETFAVSCPRFKKLWRESFVVHICKLVSCLTHVERTQT